MNHITQYQHIIWDWNGTLLDDVDACVGVINDMLARRNMEPLSKERYRELLGFPVVDFYRRIGFDFAQEPYEAIADEYIAGYDHCWQQCRLHTGARDVLAAIGRAGMTQSVLSAYQQKRLAKAVEFFGLGRWFIRLVGLNDYYAHSKTENGIRWIEELGRPGSRVLLIGDTLHDYEVAQAMGVDCVLMSCGHNDRNRLSACGAELLDGLNQLLDQYLAN